MAQEDSSSGPPSNEQSVSSDTKRMQEVRRQAIEEAEKRLSLVDEAGNPLSREEAQQRIAGFQKEISDQALQANEEGKFDRAALERYFIGSVLAVDAGNSVDRADLGAHSAMDRLKKLYGMENVFPKTDAGGTTTPRAILENAANTAQPPQTPNLEVK